MVIIYETHTHIHTHIHTHKHTDTHTHTHTHTHTRTGNVQLGVVSGRKYFAISVIPPVIQG